MTAPKLLAAEERAQQVAKAMLPLLTAEFIRRPEPRPLSPQEQEIMVACGDVGRAIDRLDGATFASPGAERQARKALELAARHLRKLIDLREAKHARK
ncbi:hypothetical protein EOA37_09515 [Mesorhizobium sp. M2A.F.Ca.ET.015.02.1.1]|uniref:hypothetical protein n=1 Tax=Mesorhizobium sp. M2A.F.Ca.ET.015.02.1.1 TaxID=2496758 RepID=UPI000FCBEC82|nr:hypothetical protein [Mesorhizobium sp. M2A.F.Ca.ET.015.02.1.1]RUW41490.1 hypothetical protein EOA37_09515 [Mesorhizobium sp. M2A.F.Ca.ET.015.02.1.1]